MSAYTASVNGDWTNAATWGGAGVPVKGDSWSINSGVSVAVTTAVAFGLSTGTDDGVINGTGQLVIDPAAGGHVTAYGSIKGNNTSTTRLAGAGEGTSSVHRLVIKSGVLAGNKGITFDTSDSAAGTKYGYKAPGSNMPNNGVWLHGTDDTHRAYVGANMGASGGCGQLYSRNGFNTALGNVEVQYLNIANLGDASTPWLDAWINTTSGVSVKNLTATNCGQFTNGTAPPTNGTWEMLDCKFSGTLSGTMCGISFNNAPGTGAWRFWRCAFDRRFVPAGNLNGVDLYRCTFGQGLDYAVNKKPTIRECAVRETTAGGVVPGNGQAVMKEADVTDCILHIPDTGLGNTKWFTLSASSVDTTIDGVIVDVESADGTGEMVSIVGAPAALRIATLRRILILPSGVDATKRPENIVSVASASSNWDIRFEHNTGYADAEGIMSYSETSISPVGQITMLRDNIAYGLPATPSLVGQSGTLLGIDWRTGGTTTIDAVVPANYAGNVGYNLATYAGRYGFSGAFSVAPTQEILAANPQFAAPTRRLKTWDASLGGAGTNASAWSRLEGNPDLIRDAYDWIRDGFRPTNEALRGYAAGGTTPGAVEMAAPTGAPTIALSAGTIAFNAYQGDPASSQAVDITNSGTGTLNGLATGAVTYGAGASGWVTGVTLGAATAPTTLTVQVTPGAIAPGNYSATFPLTSTAPGVTNSPQTVTVTLAIVAPPGQSILLTPSACTFVATAGAADPAAQTVVVTNDAYGTLNGLSLGAISYGASEPTGWLTATLDTVAAPAVVTLQPATGALPAGTYHATVPVASSAPGVTNSPQSIAVTFTVAPGGTKVFGVDRCRRVVASVAESGVQP